MIKDDILEWLQNWYREKCNDDWEHSFGIKIDTIDNPGWFVVIDLNDTRLKDIIINYQLIEQNKNDWYGYKVENSKYEASGDPTKLKLLLIKFKEIVENHDN